MNGGVTASDECFTSFDQMKLKKTDRWIVFKLSDDQRQIVVDSRACSEFEQRYRTRKPVLC